MAADEKEASFAQAEIVDVEQLLELALSTAGSCWLRYQAAPATTRKQMNQRVSEKSWIEHAGSLMTSELTEPFHALVDGREVSPLDRPKGRLPG